MNEIITDERMGLPSASGLQRIALCPGSWRAEQACPQPEDSEEALMGTRLHAHMEDGSIPDDPEEAEAIEWCRYAVEELQQRCLNPTDISDFEAQKEDIREIRMTDNQRQFSGKPDLVIVYGSDALIVDYKFGRMPADAADGNLQLAALAVLVRQHYPDVTAVYTAILQPYVSRQSPLVCRYDTAQLDAAEQYIRKIIAAAQTAGAPLKPSEPACRYCRAMASCPAVTRQLLAASNVDLVAAWETWTPVERRKAYDIAKLARRWADAVAQKVETDLRSEVEIPGLTLSSGKKSFVITDPAQAFAILNGLYPYGVTAAAFTGCCKVGVTDLDKLVCSVRKAIDPKATVIESKKWLRETLAGCGETKVTKGSIKEVEA